MNRDNIDFTKLGLCAVCGCMHHDLSEFVLDCYSYVNVEYHSAKILLCPECAKLTNASDGKVKTVDNVNKAINDGLLAAEKEMVTAVDTIFKKNEFFTRFARHGVPHLDNMQAFDHIPEIKRYVKNKEEAFSQKVECAAKAMRFDDSSGPLLLERLNRCGIYLKYEPDEEYVVFKNVPVNQDEYDEWGRCMRYGYPWRKPKPEMKIVAVKEKSRVSDIIRCPVCGAKMVCKTNLDKAGISTDLEFGCENGCISFTESDAVAVFGSGYSDYEYEYKQYENMCRLQYHNKEIKPIMSASQWAATKAAEKLLKASEPYALKLAEMLDGKKICKLMKKDPVFSKNLTTDDWFGKCKNCGKDDCCWTNNCYQCQYMYQEKIFEKTLTELCNKINSERGWKIGMGMTLDHFMTSWQKSILDASTGCKNFVEHSKNGRSSVCSVDGKTCDYNNCERDCRMCPKFVKA